jgi:hypothetical protein
VNRDINEGKLPHRYQEEIYNRIAATPLRLTDNGEEKVNLASTPLPQFPEIIKNIIFIMIYLLIYDLKSNLLMIYGNTQNLSTRTKRS